MRIHPSWAILSLAAMLIACGDDGEGGGALRPTPTGAATATSRPTAATATVPAASPTPPVPTPSPPPTPSAAPSNTPEPTATVQPSATETPIPVTLAVRSPAQDEVVSEFSFVVVIDSSGPIDPDSLVALLNDVPVEVEGTPPALSIPLAPGAPLRDDNVLRLTARAADGRPVEAQVAFRYLPPKARARRITADSERITGPLAQSRVGDYLLENAVARFVVQDVAQRFLGNVGTFGGNLIDAEIVGRPGRDNFLEIQPMVNVETVINAQALEILNDGQNGAAAVIRTCGPDDTIDFINPSSSIKDRVGITLPPSVDEADYDIEGCTEYRLEPGAAHVEMVTTIHNNQDTSLGLYVGDYLAGGGQLEPWLASPDGGGGIGEILVYTAASLSYLGFGESTGVDYGYIPVPLPGSRYPNGDILAVAGVAVALHSHNIPAALFGAPPIFVVPARGERSYTRLFSVGDGSGANAVNLRNRLRGVSTGTLRGCVTRGGVPAPGARVAAGKQNAGALLGLSTHFVTGEDGCYQGTLEPGEYGAAAALQGTPFENRDTAPLVHVFQITAGDITVQDFDLPATAHLRVTVRDENDRPLPARVALVGFDPSPDPALRTPFAVGETTTFLFQDRRDDGLPFGIAQFAYSGADGVAEYDFEPGEYQLVVSRGSEYSIFERRITLAVEQSTDIVARIARVVDTGGFVSSDFHVHGLNSSDSRIANRDRVMQYAGEGIDNIVMTEHGGRTNLVPVIADLGLTDHIHSTIGEEISTWEYNHYNGYPFDIVSEHPSGGAVDWSRAAEPGRDFVRYGAYGRSPAEVDELARTGPGSRPSTVVQNNHVSGYFGPLEIDTAMVPPRSHISAAGKLAYRLDPSLDNLFHHFAAMEVWNGYTRAHQARFFDADIGNWFNHINQGLFITGTGVTDSHGFFNLNAPGAQTWTPAASDSPREIDSDQVAEQISAGRATLGQGAYAQVRLVAADGSGNAADFSLGGSTTVRSENQAVELEIRIQAPLWAAYDRIEVYANAPTFPTSQVNGTNVAYGATPRLVHRAGEDFTVERVNVFPEIPGAERLETTHTVLFADLAEDTWFVVVVRGSDGVSRPMFPVMPADISAAANATLDDLLDGNLGEGGVLAMAITNPLFADVDGTPGFQAPRAP